MQTAMYPSGGMPPLFDFGALFGVRQRGEPSWRYEAPSLKRAEPLDLCMLTRCLNLSWQSADGCSI
jgi:hypothetical protein